MSPKAKWIAFFRAVIDEGVGADDRERAFRRIKSPNLGEMGLKVGPVRYRARYGDINSTREPVAMALAQVRQAQMALANG